MSENDVRARATDWLVLGSEAVLAGFGTIVAMTGLALAFA
jgi:S-adenosylhomocysteine hydrolase